MYFTYTNILFADVHLFLFAPECTSPPWKANQLEAQLKKNLKPHWTTAIATCPTPTR